MPHGPGLPARPGTQTDSAFRHAKTDHAPVWSVLLVVRSSVMGYRREEVGWGCGSVGGDRTKQVAGKSRDGLPSTTKGWRRSLPYPHTALGRRATRRYRGYEPRTPFQDPAPAPPRRRRAAEARRRCARYSSTAQAPAAHVAARGLAAPAIVTSSAWKGVLRLVTLGTPTPARHLPSSRVSTKGSAPTSRCPVGVYVCLGTSG